MKKKEYRYLVRDAITTVVSLLKDKEEAAHTTKSSCWRPDIYLNNDRYCNGCIIYENCCCKIKRIDKKRPNKVQVRKHLQKKK